MSGITFTSEDRKLLKETQYPDFTDAELRMFTTACERAQLDPFVKQIYAQKREDKRNRRWNVTVQASIDGIRLQAARTGKYEGQMPTQWCGEDGIWRDVWLSKDPPSAARVGVLHQDFREPLYAVATWRSYAQDTFIWKSLPDVMLAKVAESLALRKAFPAELSGLYSDAEIPDEPISRTRRDIDLRPGEPEIQPPAAQQQQQEQPAPQEPAAWDKTATIEAFFQKYPFMHIRDLEQFLGNTKAEDWQWPERDRLRALAANLRDGVTCESLDGSIKISKTSVWREKKSEPAAAAEPVPEQQQAARGFEQDMQGLDEQGQAAAAAPSTTAEPAPESDKGMTANDPLLVPHPDDPRLTTSVKIFGGTYRTAGIDAMALGKIITERQTFDAKYFAGACDQALLSETGVEYVLHLDQELAKKYLKYLREEE